MGVDEDVLKNRQPRMLRLEVPGRRPCRRKTEADDWLRRSELKRSSYYYQC